MIVFSGHLHGTVAHRQCNAQGSGQFHGAFFGHDGKPLIAAVVDELEYANQIAFSFRSQDRHRQHLLGTVACTLVHRFEETERWCMPLEFGVVIDIGDVDDLAVVRGKSGDAGVIDRQLYVLERLQASLHFGDDRAATIGHGVDGKPVSLEHIADIVGDLADYFIDVCRRVDAVGHGLQLLQKEQFTADFVGVELLSRAIHAVG